MFLTKRKDNPNPNPNPFVKLIFSDVFFFYLFLKEQLRQQAKEKVS